MTARWPVSATIAIALMSVGAQAQRDRPAPVETAVDGAGTGVVSGVVVTADESQQPVRRVSLLLASGRLVTPRTAVTDDDGRFVFTGVAPGHYTLVGQKPAFVPAVYGARSPTDTQGVPIAVVNGQRVDGVRLQIMRGAVVSGLVRLPGGSPAADLSIQVLRMQVVDGRRQLSLVSMPAQTNDRGAYRVFGLPPGDYVVQARSPVTMMPGSGGTRLVIDAEVRWADQRLAQTEDPRQAAGGAPPPPGPTVTYGAVYFPGTTFASDAAVLTLRQGEERHDVDFGLVLDPTAKVSGTVIGPDGAPSAGAVVQLEAEGSSGDIVSFVMGMLGGSGRTTTRPDGTFVLSGVTPGRYLLTARGTPRQAGTVAPAPAESGMAEAMAMTSVVAGILGGGADNPATLWASDTVAVTGKDVESLSLTLREGLTIEGSIVADGIGVPPEVAALRITVGKPLTGDRAAAMLARATSWSTAAPRDDGTFTVRGLIPGRYEVAVTGKGMRMASLVPGMTPALTGWVVRSIRWKDRDLADSGIDIQADVPVTGVVVTLTPQPAQLDGTVMDAAGRPTGAFPIVVFSTDRAHWGAGSRRVLQAQPASDGTFTVIGLPAGEYYLAAVTRLEPGDLANRQFLEELLPASLRITIGEGEKKTQDLRLSGG